MTHRGDYIGGRSGIDRSTKMLVSAELWRIAKSLAPADYASAEYARGLEAAMDVLRTRAEEIEDAAAVRWSCGVKVGDPHPVGEANCPACIAETEQRLANAQRND